ncbi:unnamed protein product [Ectocarpus sp. 13 AM-2016]
MVCAHRVYVTHFPPYPPPNSAPHHNGGHEDYVARGREPSLRTKGMIAPRCVQLAKHPRRSYSVCSALEEKAPEKYQVIRSCHPYARMHKMPSILSRMQRTLHVTRRIPYGTSRLVV